jgi:hypothetical protein
MTICKAHEEFLQENVPGYMRIKNFSTFDLNGVKTVALPKLGVGISVEALL